MYFFSSDEHLGHVKILRPDYCDRGRILNVDSIEEHDAIIVARHNEVVGKDDIVVHAGDFCWCKNQEQAYRRYINGMNGNHIFIKGSHDHWLPASAKCRWRKMLQGQFVVVDHYPGRSWERAYHSSWQLYGHWHHNELGDIGLQHNICIDLHDFYPWSFDEIKEVMARKIVKRN